MLARLASLFQNPFVTPLAQVVPRIDPQVVDLVHRMESHILAQPWHPLARWIALTLYTVPAFRILLCPVDRVLARQGTPLPPGLQRINNAAGYFEATLGTLRDVAFPVIFYSAHRQGSDSIDWYVPEIIAGILTVYSVFQKLKLLAMIDSQLSQKFKALAQGLRVFIRST